MKNIENIRFSERHYTSSELEKVGKKVIFRQPSEVSDIKVQKDRLFPDDKIRQNVLETLYRSTLLDASKIEVIVKEGKVFLSGSVGDSQEKSFASQVIEFVPGIVEIYNDLIITDHYFH